MRRVEAPASLRKNEHTLPECLALMSAGDAKQSVHESVDRLAAQ
jgi:hypothetical protein